MNEILETKIGEIEIMPVRPQNGLVGFVSFVLDHKWRISNIALYTRPQGGYRLVYPTKRLGMGELMIFYPIDRITGDIVEKMVGKKADDLWSV